MIKYIFSIIIICLIFYRSTTFTTIKKNDIISQVNNKGKILWSSNRNLTWEDFKGTPIKNSGLAVAEIQCEIKIVNSYWNDNLPKYDIRCYFVKSKSWSSVTDTLTLSHEQLHFDIYELYTRKIRKEFQKLNLKEESNTNKYNSIYVKLVNEAIKENKDYDNEVYFNNKKQLEWIDRITEELEELKKYEYIPLKHPQ